MTQLTQTPEMQLESEEVVIVTPEMEQELKAQNEKFIDAQLATVGADQKLIAKLRADYGGLQITSLEDKNGIKTVDAARKHVKRIRLAVQNRTKEILEVPKHFTMRVKEATGSLVDALAAIEDELALQEAKVTQWKQEEQKRKEDEERRIVNERCAMLDEAGIPLKGQAYIIGDESIHMNDVCDYKQDEFERWLDNAKLIKATLDAEEVERKKIQSRRLDISKRGGGYDEETNTYRIADIIVLEEDIAKATAEAWQELISKIDSTLDAIKKKEEEDAKELQRLQDEKDKAAETIFNLRKDQLISKGILFKGDKFYIDGVEGAVASVGTISAMDNEDFARVANSFGEKVEANRKKIEAQQEAERKKNEHAKIVQTRQTQLSQLRFEKVQDGFESFYKNEEGNEVHWPVHHEEILNSDEDKWNGIIKGCIEFNEQKAIAEKKIADANAKKAEAEKEQREAALKPDKDKLLALASKFGGLWKEFPEFETDTAKLVAHNAKAKIKEVADYLLDKSKDLI